MSKNIGFLQQRNMLQLYANARLVLRYLGFAGCKSKH